MTNRLHNLSKEKLISHIEDQLSTNFLRSFEEICEAIYELKSRCKFSHRLINDQLYRHYAEVRNGRLTAAMVHALGGDKRFLKHMEGRPVDLQNKLAGGQLVSIVKVKKGEIVEENMAIQDMNYATFARAFPVGQHPAALGDQRKALEAELASKPAPTQIATKKIVIDLIKKSVAVGRETVPLGTLIAALKEIGLEVSGISKLDEQKDAA